MEGWNKIQSSLSGLNLGQSATKFAKGFNSSVQATRERLGQVAPEEITELPHEYRVLEARVDALRQAHVTLLKIAKVYENESYDYPTQIQESITQLSTTIGHGITNLAATGLKGTNLPAPAPVANAPAPHKTLPHAFARAADTAKLTLQSAAPEVGDDKLAKATELYASAWEKISAARVVQDETIRVTFVQPWQTTLTTSIAVAMKARQAVNTSRLELDAAKQSAKNASVSKQDHARLELEHAEDDLVQKTEVAILLMKAVLENPEPLKNINELIKAQLAYSAATAEALSTIQGDVEELSVAAEGEYRKSRDH